MLFRGKNVVFPAASEGVRISINSKAGNKSNNKTANKENRQPSSRAATRPFVPSDPTRVDDEDDDFEFLNSSPVSLTPASTPISTPPTLSHSREVSVLYKNTPQQQELFDRLYTARSDVRLKCSLIVVPLSCHTNPLSSCVFVSAVLFTSRFGSCL